jgi:hypothetical protein
MTVMETLSARPAPSVVGVALMLQGVSANAVTVEANRRASAASSPRPKRPRTSGQPDGDLELAIKPPAGRASRSMASSP